VTFNLQRSALLVAALASGSAEVFPEALADRLHQPYRAALVPGLPEILALRGDGLLGCCLSGAGPSVLVLHKSTAPGWPERVAEIFAEHGQRSEIHRTKIQTDGYTLAELP
jgi:homoserine kinase